MAMMTRRAFTGGALLLAVAFATRSLPSSAQGNAEAARFIEQAYASAVFQKRISDIAAVRDVRPEIRDLANAVLAARAAQIPKLAELAKSQGVQLRETLNLELQSILENLEPLDMLALSRRYIEVEMQALAGEMKAYETTSTSADPALKAYAESMVPVLREISRKAEVAFAAVRP